MKVPVQLRKSNKKKLSLFQYNNVITSRERAQLSYGWANTVVKHEIANACKNLRVRKGFANISGEYKLTWNSQLSAHCQRAGMSIPLPPTSAFLSPGMSKFMGLYEGVAKAKKKKVAVKKKPNEQDEQDMLHRLAVLIYKWKSSEDKITPQLDPAQDALLVAHFVLTSERQHVYNICGALVSEEGEAGGRFLAIKTRYVDFLQSLNKKRFWNTEMGLPAGEKVKYLLPCFHDEETIDEVLYGSRELNMGNIAAWMGATYSTNDEMCLDGLCAAMHGLCSGKGSIAEFLRRPKTYQ